MNAHPSSEQFRRLAAGQLSPAEQESVEAHVDACPHCQEALARLLDEGANGSAAALERLLPQLDLPGPASAVTGDFLADLQDRPPTLDAPELEAGGDEVLPTVPGYEILGVLGRGGMGVVYKAQHLKLKRLVALKTIKAGMDAEPHELERFRLEAEAVARMQHANIVQIHEVGEAEGRPFFALELVEGGSLNDKLDGTPWPAPPAAQLVETLARAVHAAHQQGIIHRDLKPANVLLTADGTPKVTDFGLAKRLDVEVGQTQSGAILGSPSYMAPEQADTEQKRFGPVGPAADVYALGAILYELLTGRPPFKAATSFDTILQVASEEPVPPRRLQPKVPVDLETICLKCLQKQPVKRYPTAEELAEDVQRFQEGRPIRARRIGVVGRTARWCRRNPVQAGLVMALLLVLLTGTGISLYFAVAEAIQAKQARRNGEELKITNTNLTRSYDELERTLARSLLRPLGLEKGQSLTDPEIEALWELAENRGERLGYRFVEEALSGQVTTRQLWRRASLAVHAAVGLEPAKREEVERLLVKHLQDAQLSRDQGIDMALIAVELEDLGPTAVKVASVTLTQALIARDDPLELPFLAGGLGALAGRMESQEATQAAAALTQAMQAIAKTPDSDDLPELARGLAAVAGRAEPREAARLCSQAADALLQSMGKTADLRNLYELVNALAIVAGCLESREAARIAAALTETMSTETTGFQPLMTLRDRTLAHGLTAVARRLEPREAARLCSLAATTLLREMAKTKDPTDLLRGAEGLAVVVARLEPREAARLCSRAIDTIRLAMNEGTKPDDLTRLAQGLAVLAGYLEATKAVSTLTQAMTKTTDRSTLARLTEELATVATRLEPQDAVRVAEALTQAMAMANKSKLSTSHLAVGLAAVLGRLDRQEAARLSCQAAADFLLEMTNTDDSSALPDLAKSLAAAAGFLDPQESTRLCSQAVTRLTQAMIESKESSAKFTLAKSLAAVAGHMDTREAARLCSQAATNLAQAITNSTHQEDLRFLAWGLAAVAGRLEPQEASRLCSQAIVPLAQAMSKRQDPVFTRFLAACLADVARYLEPAEAAQVAAILIQADTRESAWTLAHMAPNLGKVAGRLSPQEAARLRLQTATALMRAMTMSQFGHSITRIALESDQNDLSRSMVAIFTDSERATLPLLAESVAAIGLSANNGRPLVFPAPLILLMQPRPCLLSTPELVELLKQPTCVRNARRVILDQLENRYQRKFADHWEFVRFVQEQKLPLDLTSPPQRLASPLGSKRGIGQ